MSKKDQLTLEESINLAEQVKSWNLLNTPLSTKRRDTFWEFYGKTSDLNVTITGILWNRILSWEVYSEIDFSEIPHCFGVRVENSEFCLGKYWNIKDSRLGQLYGQICEAKRIPKAMPTDHNAAIAISSRRAW